MLSCGERRQVITNKELVRQKRSDIVGTCTKMLLLLLCMSRCRIKSTCINLSDKI